MQPVRATTSRQPDIAVTVHVTTGLPKPGPADIVASYAPGPPPAGLVGQYRMAPQQLFHAVTCYLASPREDQYPLTILDSGSQEVPVKVLHMTGFDVTVEVPSLNAIFDFDATVGDFCLGAAHVDATKADLEKAAATAARAKTRVTANDRLCGKSSEPLETNLARIAALLSIREDLRPSIVITNRFGEQAAARVLDVRGSHVLLLVLEGPGAGQHVFDLANAYKQLNFRVSESDAASHCRYLQAMREAGGPFPLHDKA